MKEINKEIRVFEAFAGYGGASFGLRKAGIPHRIVGYSEIKPFACKLYELNHKNIINYGDITKINPKEIPDFDLFTGGFPCQAFSTAGKGLGELETRGTLFYEIIRICEHKQPENILLENVKGLLTRRHSKTFSKILSELERIGYNVKYALMNSKDYGVPQNRERVWIFATKKEFPESWHLAPRKESLRKFFKDFLDKEVDQKYYKNQKQVQRLIDITGVDLSPKESSCLDIYNKKLRTDGISITLTEPHHNTLRVVHPKVGGQYMLRKLTEQESFRLMGFKDGEIILGDLTYSQLCECAGNGWDVNLVSKIFKHIFQMLQTETCGINRIPQKVFKKDLFF